MLRAGGVDIFGGDYIIRVRPTQYLGDQVNPNNLFISGLKPETGYNRSSHSLQSFLQRRRRRRRKKKKQQKKEEEEEEGAKEVRNLVMEFG
ncbi:hypothetical protein ACLB2K_061906 [Fragaria x ananassa]